MKREGKTIIFSTHVLHQAELLCDRVFMINKGKKILDGSIDEIREQFNPRTVIAEPTLPDDKHEPMLASIAGVESVSRRGEEAGFELHLGSNASSNEVMAAALAAAPMRRVELRRATLEDVFVSLVDPGDSEDSVRAELSGALPAGARA